MQIFTGVVDTTVSRNKEVFWDELGAIKVLLHDSWCIVGDFNKYRFPMRRFSEVINVGIMAHSLLKWWLTIEMVAHY